MQPDDTPDVTARHDVALPLNNLLDAIDVLLTEHGSAFLLLPYEPFKNPNVFLSTKPFGLAQAVAVKNFSDKSPIRWMLELKRDAPKTAYDEIVIYNTDKTYTHRFIELLKPYYLYL